MTDSAAASPLTSPPAIGEPATVHGMALVVRSVAGDKVTLAASNVASEQTTMQWAALQRTADGALETPSTDDARRQAKAQAPEPVVPMAEDDPRWVRIRENAANPKSRQAAGLLEQLTETYATATEG